MINFYSLSLIFLGLATIQFLYFNNLYSYSNPTMYVVYLHPLVSILIGTFQSLMQKFNKYYCITFYLYYFLLYLSLYLLVLGMRDANVSLCESIPFLCKSSYCSGGELGLSALIYITTVYLSLILAVTGPRYTFKHKFANKKDMVVVLPEQNPENRWVYSPESAIVGRSASVSLESASISTPRAYRRKSRSTYEIEIREAEEDNIDDSEDIVTLRRNENAA